MNGVVGPLMGVLRCPAKLPISVWRIDNVSERWCMVIPASKSGLVSKVSVLITGLKNDCTY